MKIQDFDPKLQFYTQKQFNCATCIKRTWGCFCCGSVACQLGLTTGICKGVQSLCLSLCHCGSALWTACAPCCMKCRCGDRNITYVNTIKSIRYSLFGCLMILISPFQGLYGCCRIGQKICFEDNFQPPDLYTYTNSISDSVSNCLNLELTQQPFISIDQAINKEEQKIIN